MKKALIVGASAAGLSAAIYLKRHAVDFNLIAKDIGGEMILSGEIGNYPGIAATTGFELTKQFQKQAELNQIEIETGVDVNEIKSIANGFQVNGQKNNQLVQNEANAILVATGSTPKKLGLPGEKEFYQRGLSYCAVCDGPVFKNKNVAIVGGGNSALEAGLMLAELCPQVYLITINDALQGDAILIRALTKKSNVKIIYRGQTKEFFGENNFLKGLTYFDLNGGQTEKILVDGVFIHIGLNPNSDFIPEKWGVKNNLNEIKIDRLGQTSQPGLFAAGDVTDLPYKQIGVATGQGVIAGLSLINFLNNLDA